MHPRTEHLLSLRDGEPVDAADREHLANCAACRSQLDDLESMQARLRSLPVLDAKAGGWAGVQARLAQRGAAARQRTSVARLAVAASIAVIAVTVAWRAVDERSARDVASISRATPVAAEEALALDRVAQLQSQSQALDHMLAAIGERPAIERGGTAVPIESLEAQVQWVDHKLSDGGDTLAATSAEQLWRERVDLMNSLVRLRYVEAQSIAM